MTYTSSNHRLCAPHAPPCTQSALESEVAWLIIYMKYACIPEDASKGAGLKEVVSEHKDMVATLRALKTDKNTYVHLIKPSDIRRVVDEVTSDEEDGSED